MDILDAKLPPLWIGGKRFNYQAIPLMKRSELFSILFKEMRGDIILLPDTNIDSLSFQFVWLYLNGAVDSFQDIRQYIPVEKIDWKHVLELFNYFMVPLESNIMMEIYLHLLTPEDIMGTKITKQVEEHIGNKYKQVWGIMTERKKVDIIYDAESNGYEDTHAPVSYTVLTYYLPEYTFEDVKRDPSIIERERKIQLPEVEYFKVNILYEFERDLIHTVLDRSLYVSVSDDGQMYRTDTLERVPAEVQEAAFNNLGLQRINEPGDSEYTVTEYRISM